MQRLNPPFDAIRRELRMAGYAAGNFGKNIVWSSADLTLLFVMTDLLHVPPVVAGSFMLIGTLSDLLVDAVITGLIGRATANGIGYRMFVLIGAPICALVFALLYALPSIGPVPLWAVLGTILLFRASFAVLDVPHNTILAVVAPDSRARGRTSGYRYFFSSLGGIYTALTFARIADDGPSAAGRLHLAELGAVTAALLVATLWLASLASGRPRALPRAAPSTPTLRALLLPHLDGLFAVVAGLAFLIGFMMPMFGRALVYLTTYVLERPALMGDILIALNVGQIVGVTIWTSLVQWWSKPALLAASFLVSLAGLAMLAWVVPIEDAVLPVAGLLGVGLAGVYMLPWGIVADVIDFAEFRHGDRREVATFGAFLLCIKGSSALAAAFIGAALDVAGYVPGVPQTMAVKTVILSISFAIPMAGAIAGTLLTFRLGLGHALHRRVLTALAHRRGRRTPARNGNGAGSGNRTRVTSLEG